jgi:RimJ/RimL family protein N-acetyltransferase/SAM-dependent methyltransferase
MDKFLDMRFDMNIIKTHGVTLYGGNDEYKIVLRPLCDEHLPLLYKWNANPEVTYWTEGGTNEANIIYDSNTVHQIYGGVSQNNLCFLVEVNGASIGECWLQRMNLPEVRAMYNDTLDVRRIDMSIGEKAYWSKGIGTLFIGMLIDYAFNGENVDLLHCFCEDYNIRSRRVWEKNGFKQVLAEPLLPQPQKGKWQYHYRLTREEYINNMNEATRKDWDAHSDEYFSSGNEDYDIIATAPERAFPAEVWEMLRTALPDLRGKRVLVPSSGDNIAAFGLYLLGAEVTSTDISDNQLSNAKKIADTRGWNVKFQQADSMTLDGLQDGAFDLVYTSNGVHVWISDLAMMYRSFNRVLKPGGQYIFFDTHPFSRPFDDSGSVIKIEKDYRDVGPFGDVPNYHWRVEDFLRSLIAAGFTLEDYRDLHSSQTDLLSYDYIYYGEYGTYAAREADGGARYDWRNNPWAALPQKIAVSASARK